MRGRVGAMFEGFSGQARKAIALAHRDARRLNHDYVGTEHVLLGVFRERSEGVAALLRGAGLDVEQAYREVESHLPRGTDAVSGDKLPLTPGAKRALQHARQEALNL